MGASYIDYLVADRVVAPPEHVTAGEEEKAEGRRAESPGCVSGHYMENLLYMPHTYQINYYPTSLLKPLQRRVLEEAIDLPHGLEEKKEKRKKEERSI